MSTRAIAETGPWLTKSFLCTGVHTAQVDPVVRNYEDGVERLAGEVPEPPPGGDQRQPEQRQRGASRSAERPRAAHGAGVAPRPDALDLPPDGC